MLFYTVYVNIPSNIIYITLYCNLDNHIENIDSKQLLHRFKYKIKHRLLDHNAMKSEGK